MDNNDLKKIRAKITEAVAKRKLQFLTGDKVTITAVTKNHGADVILDALSFGLDNIGENRVQEAKAKQEILKNETGFSKLNWHLLGHLQTNKVKQAVNLFQIIESVDSVRLLDLLNQEAAKINKIQDVLLQINIAEETQKSGFSIQEFDRIIFDLKNYQNVRVRGVMVIAPNTEEKQIVRDVFQKGYQVFARLNKIYPVDILSMGMTNDFEIAVEEGANFVRIGRALFGERDYSIKF